MSKRVLILQAHPDAGGGHFGDGLAQRYAQGAEGAGSTVEWVVLNQLDFPLLGSAAEWRELPAPDSIADAQAAILRCNHMAFFYPLWMGDMPALLKGFLEQVMRPGFAFDEAGDGRRARRLEGRSARLVVTMGMPALIYRGFYRAHSVASFRRNILHFAGIRPVRTSLVGLVEGPASHRENWLARMTAMGSEAR